MKSALPFINPTRASLLIAAICCCHLLAGQSTRVDLVPYQAAGKWGYMNQEKEVVIEPQYDEASFFHIVVGPPYTSLARVKINEHFGVIDAQGDQFLPPNYDSIALRATLTTTGNYGMLFANDSTYYFDHQGEVMPQYPGDQTWICGVGMFHDNFVVKEVQSFDDSTGTYNYGYRRMVVRKDSSGMSATRDSVYALLDSIVHFQSRPLELLYNRNGQVDVCHNMLNNRGNPVIKVCMTYDEIRWPDEAPAIFGRSYEPQLLVKKDNNWGVLDLKIMMEPRIRTDYRSRWEIAPPKYERIIDKQRHYYLVEYEKGKLGYIRAESRRKLVEYWPTE